MERWEEVLDYWFGPRPSDDPAYIASRMPLWFGGAKETDDEIRARFGADVAAAAAGRLAAWEAGERSCLALIVLLDQFSLNIHRDLPRSFEQSAMAIPIALRAIGRGLDARATPPERVFFYLPLEHAEDLALQRRSVELFTALERSVPEERREPFATFRWYAEEHRKPIERFGRFPDRNEILGRAHTEEEARYMAEGGPPF